QEESGEGVEQPVLAAESPGDEMEDGPGDDAEAESVGDGVSEGDEHESEEGGNGNDRLVPADLGDGGQHERPDQNEGRGGGGLGHDADERGRDHGDQKQQAGDDGGDAAAPAGCDAGRGLDIAGYGGCAGERSEDGGSGIGEQDAVE